MKKVYVTPEFLVVSLKVNQLMAGSINRTDVDGLGVSNNSEGITYGNARRSRFSDADDWDME